MKVSRLAEDGHLSRSSLHHYSWKAGHVQGQCKMGPKNAESFSEEHSSPVLARELGAAHWGSGTFFSTFDDRRRDLGISQRSWVQTFFGVNDFQAIKKSRRRSRPGLKNRQKIFFSMRIKSLQQKWAKFIELTEDYIKKNCDKSCLSYSGR